MNTLVLFSSKHGSAKYAAERIASKLKNDFTIVDLDRKSNISLEQFDSVIMGGSVYAGRMRSSIVKFVKKNENELAKKKLGFYIICMSPMEKVPNFFIDFYGKSLAEKAAAKEIFGGKYDFDKMNFIEKFIIKKISGVNSTVSTIDEDLITKFSEKFN